MNMSPTQLIEQLHGVDEMRVSMKNMGVPEHVMEQWICLRYHTHHPWGIAPCVVNGQPSWIIGYIAQIDGEDRAVVGAVFTTKEMDIRDMNGNKMDEKLSLPVIDYSQGATKN